jgi:hypothetical protein
MFNPWLELSLKAVQMGMEAQNLIALRMLRLAGGARMEAEASRMVAENVAAEAQGIAAVAGLSHRPPHVVANKALRVVKKRVRANKRRPSRH